MKTIKLTCSDIDGTLLNAKRDLSQQTISTLNKLKNTVPIILISSRMPSAMQHLQKQIGIEHFPLVAYNGGLVCVNGIVLLRTTIPYHIVASIIEFNKENLHLSLYNENHWYAPLRDNWTKREINNTKVQPTIKSNEEVLKHWKANKLGAHKIMCMGNPKLVNEFYMLLSEEFSSEIHLYRSKDTYIEMAPKQISKQSAIEFLITSEFDLDVSDVMSFGDNYNDIEMLKACGLGLAVGNAKEEVKFVANEVIGYAKEDGVADFLNTYFKL